MLTCARISWFPMHEGMKGFNPLLLLRLQLPHAICRIYYALQTIIPPIILTLVAFSTFLVAKEKFVDRLKALVGLMFPLYIFQFSLSATLPQTFTLLAPNYLVFVSLITLLLMVAIAVVSFIIVARQEHFSWCACPLFLLSTSVCVCVCMYARLWLHMDIEHPAMKAVQVLQTDSSDPHGFG